MSKQFKVGDVVVCVAARTKGRIGRVGKVTFTGDPTIPCNACGGCAGVSVSCFPDRGFKGCWCSNAFRHLPKADEQFTTQMRALKPRKVEA